MFALVLLGLKGSHTFSQFGCQFYNKDNFNIDIFAYLISESPFQGRLL